MIEVLVALLSLAMAIQTAAVRSLDIPGVFTTAGTFTLVALAGALAGTRLRAEIPRLIGVLLGFVAGALGEDCCCCMREATPRCSRSRSLSWWS